VSLPTLNLAQFLRNLKTVKGLGALAGYPFSVDPSTDIRVGYIAAQHQDALCLDIICGIKGFLKIQEEWF
jgi:hypothetical protein